MADVFLLQFALYLWSNVVSGQSRKDVVYSIDVVFVLESSQTSSKLINLGIVHKNLFGGGEVGKWLGGGWLMSKCHQKRRGKFFQKFKLFLRGYQYLKREM